MATTLNTGDLLGLPDSDRIVSSVKAATELTISALLGTPIFDPCTGHSKLYTETRTLPPKTPLEERRCMIVFISNLDIMENSVYHVFFRHGEDRKLHGEFTKTIKTENFKAELVENTGLPIDVELIEWGFSVERNGVAIGVAHKSFQKIPEGCHLPIWENKPKLASPMDEFRLGRRPPQLFSI
ncbi:MAG: hypothetical protein JEZ11_17890 [Desulfobacterales bacterium]|nr:hypothetical protein [Desulfobacterales bacterium]